MTWSPVRPRPSIPPVRTRPSSARVVASLGIAMATVSTMFSALVALTAPAPAASAAASPNYAGYEMAAQSPSGALTEAGTLATATTSQSMAPGTSPAVAVVGGGDEFAYQGANGSLVTVTANGSPFSWGLGMMAGTSPAITALAGGGFEVAFEANTGTLWTVGQGGGSFNDAWGLGMAAGTSPAITALAGGGVEVAFQANTGTLWTIGAGGGSINDAWGLGMAAGTSPSITGLGAGGFEVAFQANTGTLWTIGAGGGSINDAWGLGMHSGSSPAITGLGAGGFEAAFEANTGQLWTIGAGGGSSDTNWGLAMAPATSPAIAASGSGFETAFQASSGHLTENGAATSSVDSGQSMAAGTSPAIAPPVGTSVANTTASAGSPYASGATGYDISWPQCGGAYPPQAPVAVVGVNNGSAFSTNPCFSSEASWGGAQLSVYLNLNSPQGSNSAQWGQGPAGACAVGDLVCESYNYGYNTAVSSIQTATGSGYRSYTWWLDVETGNYWTSSTSANAQVVAGALAAIRGAGYQVAIYGTGYQWSQIVGSYVPNAPAWYPTGTATATPYNWCSSSSFAGGPIYLVQSAAGSYDGDYSC